MNKQFEKWLNHRDRIYLLNLPNPMGVSALNLSALTYFKQLPLSMKNGVLTDFFESVGII